MDQTQSALPQHYSENFLLQIPFGVIFMHKLSVLIWELPEVKNETRIILK